MTEKEKMLQGLIFNAMDKELLVERQKNKVLLFEFNTLPPSEGKNKQKILKTILGSLGKGSYVEHSFKCDYGYNIHLSHQVFINFDCIMLDAASIHIGEKTLIGPKAQLLTTTHPTDSQLRLQGLSHAKPIKIGKGVWIGAGTIILPGIEIGDHSIIGAGSIVTKNIPANSTAVGNPCKVISNENS